MKTQSRHIFYTVVGLFLGLVGTLFSLHMSSLLESTPALMGGVSAVWCAVSGGIIGGQVKKHAK